MSLGINTYNHNSLFSLTINKENELEKILLKHIPPGAFVAGYGQGIGQLLTHAIKKHQSYYNGLH